MGRSYVCCEGSRYNHGVPFVIRDARPEDFEALWRLDQECFPAGIAYSRQELKFYMRRRGAIALVAEAEGDAVPVSGKSKDKHGDINKGSGKIAGFIVAQSSQSGSGGHIITIDVMASGRRSGAGSQLLRTVEERLAAGGAKSVMLETAVDNVAAQSFYERHGYSVIRTMPRYYSNGMDALALKKDLI